MRMEIDNWKRVVVLVSVARDGSPESFIDCCKPMMLKLSRFVTSTPFRSASQFCQRAYQSRWGAAFWLSTRHFSVIRCIGRLYKGRIISLRAAFVTDNNLICYR